MIAWGRRDDIKREVANLPDSWFVAFIGDPKHANDFRKLGTSRNSTMLYRTEAILREVEEMR